METQQTDASSNTIQTELNRLLTGQPNGEGAKACLFNLIVYTHEPRRTDYFKEVVKMIMSQFPCRIIFIQGNPSAKDNDLKVKVTTEKSSDERGIVCDQIFIEAAGQDINRVYFLLFPILVPDLPIYLLWGQDPTTEYTILPHLQYFATRLIFDSEATDNLQQFSRDMLNRMDSSTTQIVDMNWAKMGGWREVLAQVFDSQERFEQLTKVNIIEIFYNDQPSDLFLHPDTQAVYLQAWLASRMGWQFQRAEKSNQSQILYYLSEQAFHQIHLTPQTHPDFEVGEIVELHFKGSDYECHLKRSQTDQIEVQTCNQSQCTLPFILLMPTLRSGRSFMQEIFYQKMSDQYMSTLPFISLLNWS